MTRPDLVALLLLAVGFVAQPSEDRFGYLMGVAWLGIVSGCLEMWKELRDASS